MGSELQSRIATLSTTCVSTEMAMYGNGARDVDGNFWRTNGDVGIWTRRKVQLWGNVTAYGFGQAGIEKWAGPGGWNDPDNLLIGQIQVGRPLMPRAADPQ